MTDEDELIVVRPEYGNSGAAVWCDGNYVFPLCGTDDCLGTAANWAVLSVANSWICRQCLTEYTIDPEAPAEARMSWPKTEVQQAIAAWLGVPVEAVNIA